ncbi:hypothetical protein BC832DRAFT_110956 [Gaertneriomyces semiglobifer]|nr:hypothetical protein BC832DRAFT_110956 [Gaertneriomyces semiglobifer]
MAPTVEELHHAQIEKFAASNVAVGLKRKLDSEFDHLLDVAQADSSLLSTLKSRDDDEQKILKVVRNWAQAQLERANVLNKESILQEAQRIWAAEDMKNLLEEHVGAVLDGRLLEAENVHGGLGTTKVVKTVAPTSRHAHEQSQLTEKDLRSRRVNEETPSVRHELRCEGTTGEPDPIINEGGSQSSTNKYQSKEHSEPQWGQEFAVGQKVTALVETVRKDDEDDMPVEVEVLYIVQVSAYDPTTQTYSCIDPEPDSDQDEPSVWRVHPWKMLDWEKARESRPLRTGDAVWALFRDQNGKGELSTEFFEAVVVRLYKSKGKVSVKYTDGDTAILSANEMFLRSELENRLKTEPRMKPPQRSRSPFSTSSELSEIAPSFAGSESP